MFAVGRMRLLFLRRDPPGSLCNAPLHGFRGPVVLACLVLACPISALERRGSMRERCGLAATGMGNVEGVGV